MNPKSARRILGWLLTIVGCGLMVAFAFVFLPAEYMADIHGQLGLGEFPAQPITIYLAKSTSLLYGVHGLLMFIVGRNLPAYLGLANVFGWVHVVIGLAMLFIDLAAGMPWWWTAFEGLPVALTGALIVWLAGQAAREPIPG